MGKFVLGLNRVIISRTGPFAYALVDVGAATMLGALSYVFLPGDIERIVPD